MESQTIYQKSFFEVFNAIKETFSFSSEEDFFDFKRKYEISYSELAQVENDYVFFVYLKKFLASLRNSHTRLGKCSMPNFFKPNGYDVLIIDNKFY